MKHQYWKFEQMMILWYDNDQDIWGLRWWSLRLRYVNLLGMVKLFLSLRDSAVGNSANRKKKQQKSYSSQLSLMCQTFTLNHLHFCNSSFLTWTEVCGTIYKCNTPKSYYWLIHLMRFFYDYRKKLPKNVLLSSRMSSDREDYHSDISHRSTNLSNLQMLHSKLLEITNKFNYYYTTDNYSQWHFLVLNKHQNISNLCFIFQL